ncbi:MAG TPA: YggS family pyridoxal phosphate-dependent enzyme [Polyangiaceae bacterium]|nr:YggS family pyridoxal phosphate-dependent enzyme [Polyangiaceae bacterium]
MSVKDELSKVRARIREATLAAGREANEVELIAVSKLQPSAAIREAYAAGQRDFGENYVQELCEKAAELRDLSEIRWHLIGHLQRNKAKKIAPLITAIHSVDSVELVLELGKRVAAAEAERRALLGAERARLDVLVEVSIAREAQKSGAAPEDVAKVIEAIEREPSLRLRGLMCVPPMSEQPEDARPHFEALVRLRDTLGGRAHLPELSMGMTADLEVAIAAGATSVRVGTAIFGQRPRPGT